MELMNYTIVEDTMSEKDIQDGLYSNYKNGYDIEELLTTNVGFEPAKYGRIIKALKKAGVKFSPYLEKYAR